MRRMISVATLVLPAGMVAGCSAGTSSGGSTTSTRASGTSTTGAGAAAVGTAKWVASNGSVVTTLTSDAGSLATSLPDAVSSKNLASVSGACQKLSTDVAAAQSKPPIPSAKLQETWSSALTSLAKAATQCTTGVAQNNADLVNQASSAVTSSKAALSSITKALGI